MASKDQVGSGLGVIGDTCHHKVKKKKRTHGIHVSHPYIKIKLGIRTDEGKRKKKGKRKMGKERGRGTKQRLSTLP